MKPNLLILSILLCIGAKNYAQNVNIPDANFKAALVGNVAINTNGDSEIQVSEANAFTSIMDVNGLGISNLTGIEAFIQLDTLICSYNGLNQLDISTNIALKNLQCNNNPLTQLDVSNNTLLQNLRCHDNQLTQLNISNNTFLQNLQCNNNQLGSLDVSNNTLLQNFNCQNNQLSSLNIFNNTALDWLNCSYNLLSSLDISNNSILIGLACENNYLTFLDVFNNIYLFVFYCSNNQLTSLDISNNINLFEFFCNNNPNLHCIQVWDTTVANAMWHSQLGWLDSTMYFSLDCNYTSTAENLSSYFTFTPNPASDYLYIDSKGEKNVSFTISDIWGRSIEAWQDKTEVPISHLPVGVYFLTAQAGDKKVVKKFVKE